MSAVGTDSVDHVVTGSVHIVVCIAIAACSAGMQDVTLLGTSRSGYGCRVAVAGSIDLIASV